MVKGNKVRENINSLDPESLANIFKRNNLIDLDQALYDKIIVKIENIESNECITEKKAKSLIEEWYKKNPLFSKDFNINKLQISIENKVALFIKSQYHYERRKIIHKQEPLRNQDFGNSLEGIWDKPTQNKFQEKTSKWERGGSGKIIDCDKCYTSGKITCEECHGHGEISVKCPNCKGKGFINLPSVTIGKAKKIGSAVTQRTEQCLTCRATGYIKKKCDICNGKGEVTCKQCIGKGKVFKYEMIEATSFVLNNNIILSPYEKIKDKWIANTKTDFQIGYQNTIDEQKVKKIETSNGKYLLERYKITVLPITRVSFKYKGKERELFIINNKIKAADTSYLLDKKKTTLLIIIISAILTISGVLGYNIYQTNKAEKIFKINKKSIELAKCTIEQANNNNIAEAKECLSKIDIYSTDLKQATKDSINNAIYTFLMRSVENNNFDQVRYVHDKYYSLKYLSEYTKEIIEDMIILSDISQQYQAVATAYNMAKDPSGNDYQDVKNWEKLLNMEIKTLKLLNSDFHNEEFTKSLNKDQFIELVKTTVNDYNKFVLNNYLQFGSREKELRTFLNLIEQIEEISGLKFTKIKKQVNQAIEKHKKKWN